VRKFDDEKDSRRRGAGRRNGAAIEERWEGCGMWKVGRRCGASGDETRGEVGCRGSSMLDLYWAVGCGPPLVGFATCILEASSDGYRWLGPVAGNP
jgi:hypothetical protein